MIHPSTFSIVAFDPQAQAWGVAVASKFPAVGAVVPWAQASRGAIATQALANTSFGVSGLELLGKGLSANAVLSHLLEADNGRETRQVGIVDPLGRSATFTGQECLDWAGGLTGPGYAVQGNVLTGNNVVSSMEAAFLSSDGELAKRLLAALMAGDQAGGDKRGRQSAALIVVKDSCGYGGFNDRMLDYRVDDDPDPIQKLGDLVQLHSLYFGKSNPAEHIQLTGSRLTTIQTILLQLGYLKSPPSNRYDQATRIAFRSFTGNENFEERCDTNAGWIDAPVYDYIIRKFGK